MVTRDVFTWVSIDFWVCDPPVRMQGKFLRNPEAARKLIEKEIMLGHMLGPFDKPPLKGMVYSPINFVPKASSKNGD